MATELDPVIDALCADAKTYLEAMAASALCHGLTLTTALEQFRQYAELVEAAGSCGYLQTASRGRRVRHASYRAGTAKPASRAQVNSDAQIKARAQQWGFA